MIGFFIFSGKPDLPLGTFNNTESIEHKLAKKKRHDLTNYCKAQENFGNPNLLMEKRVEFGLVCVEGLQLSSEKTLLSLSPPKVGMQRLAALSSRHVS